MCSWGPIRSGSATRTPKLTRPPLVSERRSRSWTPGPTPLGDLAHRTEVEDALARDPCSSGRGQAELDLSKLGLAMGIGPDRDQAPRVAGDLEQPHVQVLAVRERVDL